MHISCKRLHYYSVSAVFCDGRAADTDHGPRENLNDAMTIKSTEATFFYAWA